MKLRPLKLKYEPTAENASLFARDIVASTARVIGDTLDYSVASVAVVDRILGKLRAQGVTVDQLAETLFAFGCYVGEVFVRHAAARWIETPEQWLSAIGMRICIELPEQKRLCSPISKAFKRLENGDEDSLAYFYSVFSQPREPPNQTQQ